MNGGHITTTNNDKTKEKKCFQETIIKIEGCIYDLNDLLMTLLASQTELYVCTTKDIAYNCSKNINHNGNDVLDATPHVTSLMTNF